MQVDFGWGDGHAGACTPLFRVRATLGVEDDYPGSGESRHGCRPPFSFGGLAQGIVKLHVDYRARVFLASAIGIA